MSKTKVYILFILLIAGFSGCASNLDRNLEEIQFLLDQGKFSEALTKARDVVAANPDNVDAQFLLASALLGDSVISQRSKCPNDTGYLGLIACLQDSQGEGESGFLTFTRIAPDTTDKLGELEEEEIKLFADVLSKILAN